MRKFKVFACALVLALGAAQSSSAFVLDLTLPEFSSPYHATGTYYDPYLVGTFNFNLMGEQIVSATISGQWGNSAAATTARNELWIDYSGGFKFDDTNNYSPDPYYTAYTPWSYSFSDFSHLQGGTVEFWTVQTSEYVVRLGETTLHIETSPVPEPGTMLLLGAGLLGLALYRKKVEK